MRRYTGIVLSLMFVGVLGLPAAGEIDRSPNAVSLADVECDGGLSFDQVWSPTLNSVTGHDLDQNAVGVVTSLYATTGVGDPLFAIFDRPGKGLDGLTVWCYWPDAGSPSGYAGGDVLFGGNVRP